jgi:hypothetical protein
MTTTGGGWDKAAGYCYLQCFAQMLVHPAALAVLQAYWDKDVSAA